MNEGNSLDNEINRQNVNEIRLKQNRELFRVDFKVRNFFLLLDAKEIEQKFSTCKILTNGKNN